MRCEIKEVIPLLLTSKRHFWSYSVPEVETREECMRYEQKKTRGDNSHPTPLSWESSPRHETTLLKERKPAIKTERAPLQYIMSDLAPFVATVLRDECVYQLQKENETLRRELQTERDRQMIKIVTNDSQNQVLYAQGHIQDNGKALKSANGRYLVHLEPQREITSWQEVIQTQVVVCAGSRCLEVVSAEETVLEFIKYDDASERCVIRFVGSTQSVFASLGPVPLETVLPSHSGDLKGTLCAFFEAGATLMFHCSVFHSHPHALNETSSN